MISCPRNLPQHFNGCTCDRTATRALAPATSPFGSYTDPSAAPQVHTLHYPSFDEDLHEAYFEELADRLEDHDGVRNVRWISYPTSVEITPETGWNTNAIMADCRLEAKNAIDA